MISTVIIDDEKLSRDLIKAYLKPHPEVGVVAECENGYEGIKAIQELDPALIFLDVQMPKLTGFEMLELLDVAPVIIFSTAFDQYALKAFELSAADYLLKPYSAKRFDEALAKAVHKIGSPDRQKLVQEVIHHKRQIGVLERIVVRLGNKIVIVPVHAIELIRAEDDFVTFYSEGKKYLKQMTMKYLESALPPQQFVRVHRSFIVHVDQIDRLEAYSKDAYLAVLKNGERVSVSKTGYGRLRDLLHF